MVESLSFEDFCALHSVQLSSSGIPEYVWPSLHRKVENEIFDAGNHFCMMRLDDEEEKTSNTSFEWDVVLSSDLLEHKDPESVFLIDHAWTYKLLDAREHLTKIPGLCERMCDLMNISDPASDNVVDEVLDKMWKFNQTYSFGSSDLSVESKLPWWYIMDEFGSRIAHSDNPSVRVVPFYYIPMGVCFSVLFLLRDMHSGDQLTRDYAEPSRCRNAKWKEYYLLPWFPEDFSHRSIAFTDPTDEFFLEGREIEQITNVHKGSNCQESEDSATSVDHSASTKRHQLFSEYDKVAENVTLEEIEVIDDREQADFLFLHQHYKTFDVLARDFPNTLINQFPFESVLTVKDLMAAAVHSYCSGSCDSSDVMKGEPTWFQTCYNLVTELPQFVAYYQRRSKEALDNLWIVKPCNLARSMDTCVTDNLDCIIKMAESGPKIVCKYIQEPVLFKRDVGLVKFDMRFIVFVTSVKPLKAFVYNRFWLRFANKPFSLDHFDDYEKHFTVMNYVDSSKIKQMYCHDFIEEFCRQNPSVSWSRVYQDCCSAIRQALEAASEKEPPRGLAANRQSRAMYGVDIMLKRSTVGSGVIPVILEFNFMPDCERACNYYPDFMNDMCSVMFLGRTENCPVTNISVGAS